MERVRPERGDGLRLLFSTTANEGHFAPLAEVAAAAVRAGHEVRVAAPASYRDAVERRGFRHVAFDDAPDHLIGPVMGRLPSLSFEEANTTVVRDVFGRIDAQAAYPGVDAAIREWRPDVVVREPAEFGALAAARRAGVPHLQVAIGMCEVLRHFVELTAAPLAELSELAGLPADALPGAARTEPLVSPVPRSLDAAGDPGPLHVDVRYRAGGADGPRNRPPVPPSDRPLVYVTFGSVTGSIPPFAGSFRQALDALAGLPIDVFMTVGRQVDVDGLGPLPANATVRQWWPQDDVLAHAALVLGHGGFGTTMGAVVAGVPQVVAPIFTSDQVVNARHIDAAGVGRGVEPGPDVVERAAACVPEVLADNAFRVAAAGLAAEAAALPSATAAVDVIAGLVG